MSTMYIKAGINCLGRKNLACELATLMYLNSSLREIQLYVGPIILDLMYISLVGTLGD
jgi:hypothetical protein